MTESFQAAKRKNLTVDEYVQGILQGNRAVLSMGITLIENQNPENHGKAQGVLEKILPHAGRSLRIGISGVPGVGKSTFIENFGKRLIEKKHKVAVLAVDPSSNISGGSILGDKTRMEKLSQDPMSFIRPSPTRGTLGGVAQKTRESIFLCEAAQYDRILVETVGVGQSETMVADMVDFFMVLLLPGAGDELQGIKRGILEIADLLIIHKADGDNRAKALQAQREYEGALHILKGADSTGGPRVVACSSLTEEGMEEIEKALMENQDGKDVTSIWKEKRKLQQKKWMWDLIESQLKEDLKAHDKVKNILSKLENEVSQGLISPQKAAQKILQCFYH